MSDLVSGSWNGKVNPLICEHEPRDNRICILVLKYECVDKFLKRGHIQIRFKIGT